MSETQPDFGYLTRKRKVRFWGRNYFITPRLVSWIHGDGKQVISFTPLNTRPNYYIVRIDSAVELGSDSFFDEVLDKIYDAIEEEFGCSPEEHEVRGRTYRKHWPFPSLDADSGCAWDKFEQYELQGRA
jgi:hypothetical protein